MSPRREDFRVTRDSQRDWHRNIVSLRKSIEVFADLVDDPADLDVLKEHEIATKPIHREPAIITHPFEEADLYDPVAAAIEWPFEHPCRSRYSTGAYGVWYGAESLTASVRETVYHFRKDTLASAVAAANKKPIVQERRVHLVRCNALLVDLREQVRREPRLLHPDDYGACQVLGAELRHAGMPGVLTYSVRDPQAEIVAVFTPTVLADPRLVCFLTYRLNPADGTVTVERAPGQVMLRLSA
jgi:hypothetical protein